MIFGIETGVFIFLVFCLALVSVFEFINGFHDTANAVAPVIYTKSLKPKKAVLIAALMNFLGVILGGIGVAIGIIHLLPLDAIGYQSTSFGIIVLVSLLLSAIIWNFATWYFGIPASSSHSLIGAILGVTIMMTIIPMKGNIEVKPNWDKLKEVIESLLISPVLGFIAALVVMFISYKFIRSKYYFSTPSKKENETPKIWLRSILIATSAWVSFAHGSNDGQKGVGLAVLILVILAPTVFAIDPNIKINDLNGNIYSLERSINTINIDNLKDEDKKIVDKTVKSLASIKETVNSNESVNKFEFRENVLAFQNSIKKLKDIEALKTNSSLIYSASAIDSENINKESIGLANDSEFNKNVDEISKVVDYAPWWIIALISISLGLGTMIGRKRIVVTIGEKIGKTDMNYAQATTSALITAITITFASKLHLPVSTTHILSSSVAGTMCTGPNAGGVSGGTVKNILIAWILTLPVTILLSAGLFYVGWLLFV
ncbi:inorganic phosphate transporter [Candidatus Gracilibacteria bacterium]|nr:inorganic phosphate transporter [Candidatus Gracilibacteria bacterium]